tara:strand:- start:543 stop:1106 length:564 start_codon:yes stop_codon:yes gene_type:complete
MSEKDPRKQAYQNVERLLPYYRNLEQTTALLLEIADSTDSAEQPISSIIDALINAKRTPEEKKQLALLKEFIAMHGIKDMNLSVFSEIRRIFNDWLKTKDFDTNAAISLADAFNTSRHAISRINREYEELKAFTGRDEHFDLSRTLYLAHSFTVLVMSLGLIPPADREKMRQGLIQTSQPTGPKPQN